jgi:hypothetical protein
MGMGKGLHMASFILLVVGGLNWLLVGIAGMNVVDSYLPDPLPQIVYILVGLAAVYELVTHKKNCKMCGQGMGVEA